MPFNGPQSLNPFQQGPRHPCQQGLQNNQNNFFNGPNIGGPRHNGPPRPNHIQGQVYNRPPNRQMVGPRPEFFRAPGGCQQRPRFHGGRQQHGEKKVHFIHSEKSGSCQPSNFYTHCSMKYVNSSYGIKTVNCPDFSERSYRSTKYISNRSV